MTSMHDINFKKKENTNKNGQVKNTHPKHYTIQANELKTKKKKTHKN